MFFAFFLELFSSSSYNKGHGVFAILWYVVHSKCMPQANITIKCYEYFSNTNILGEKIPVTNFN